MQGNISLVIELSDRIVHFFVSEGNYKVWLVSSEKNKYMFYLREEFYTPREVIISISSPGQKKPSNEQNCGSKGFLKYPEYC